MKRIVIAGLSALVIGGCASEKTMPDGSKMGGRVDDHESVVAKCGVGNYLFYHLKKPCEEREPMQVGEYESTEYESAGEDTLGMSESSAQREVEEPINIAEEIYFASGSTKINAEGRRALNDVAWTIKNNDERISRVNIEGHTDTTGSPSLNREIAQARAEAVKAFLVDKGVAANKLTATGFGESMPKFNTSTSTPEELAKNRRVEFTVEMTEESPSSSDSY